MNECGYRVMEDKSVRGLLVLGLKILDVKLDSKVLKHLTKQLRGSAVV